MGAYDQNQFIPVGSGLFVGQGLPVDYRTVVTDSTQRFNLDWYTAFNGLIVYQQDTQELFVLIDKGPSIPGSTISQPSSWRLVGSGGTGSAFAGEWAFTNTLNQSFAFEGSGPRFHDSKYP